ncbi:hypothetical protein Tco_0963333 [Tanacetum coccineum]
MDGGNKEINGIEESNWWPELFAMAVVVGFDRRSGSACVFQESRCFGCIDVGLYFFQNLTQIHTSGTNGIPMVPAFLTYGLRRNSHENQGVSIGSDHPHGDKSYGDLFEAN